MRPSNIGSDVLVCPACHERLWPHLDALHCGGCGLDYPRARGIPDFLRPVATSRAGRGRKPRTDDRYLSFGLPIEALDRLLWRVYSGLVIPLYEKSMWWPRVIDKVTLEHRFSADDLIVRMLAIARIERGLVLDAASGPGTLGRRLAARERPVYAVDIARPMLEWGARLSARERVTDIEFACATVECLPFTHCTFDAGIFGGALHWTSEPDRALVEIARVLKPGAPLGGYTVACGQKSDIGRKIAGRGGHLFTEDQLGASLERAGFDRVELETIGELLVFQAERRSKHQIERPMERQVGPGSQPDV